MVYHSFKYMSGVRPGSKAGGQVRSPVGCPKHTHLLKGMCCDRQLITYDTWNMRVSCVRFLWQRLKGTDEREKKRLFTLYLICNDKSSLYAFHLMFNAELLLDFVIQFLYYNIIIRLITYTFKNIWFPLILVNSCTEECTSVSKFTLNVTAIELQRFV